MTAGVQVCYCVDVFSIDFLPIIMFLHNQSFVYYFPLQIILL